MTAPIPKLRRLLDRCAWIADRDYPSDLSSEDVLAANADLAAVLDAAEAMAEQIETGKVTTGIARWRELTGEQP